MLRHESSRARSAPVVTPEKISAVTTLLEAFGCSRTILNANATRVTSLFSLDFDSAGGLVSASLQTMLLEKRRSAIATSSPSFS